MAADEGMSAKELEKALNEGDDVDLILGVWERRFAEHDWPRNDGALDQGRKLRKAVNDGITSRDTFALKQAIARAERTDLSAAGLRLKPLLEPSKDFLRELEEEARQQEAASAAKMAKPF